MYIMTSEATDSYAAGAAFLEVVDRSHIENAKPSVEFCTELIVNHGVPLRSYFLKIAKKQETRCLRR